MMIQVSIKRNYSTQITLANNALTLSDSLDAIADHTGKMVFIFNSILLQLQ